MNKYTKTLLISALLYNVNIAFAADQTNTEDAQNVVAADQTMEQSMGSSTKSGRKSMAHKGRIDSKVMDTDGDGTVSKEEYIAHHEKAYGHMKQTNGGVSIKDMNAAMNHGTTKGNKMQPGDMNH